MVSFSSIAGASAHRKTRTYQMLTEAHYLKPEVLSLTNNVMCQTNLNETITV